MHNLGEGLAIGAAYSAGELALTSVLVVGFALHNATEGFGMVAPVASLPLRIKQPLVMGFLAGFPTILGSMLGFVAYSQAIGSLLDRKSTRLNSSHRTISYAVFCLKKKNTGRRSPATSTTCSGAISPVL